MMHYQWEVDPAELFRVYDKVKSVDPVDISTNSECISQSPPDIQPKANALEDKIVSLEEQNKRLEEQLVKAEKREEWLMAANDKLTQVLESQTRLLEYTPEPIEEKRKAWFHWFQR
jgi:chromosome segregation ATPase